MTLKSLVLASVAAGGLSLVTGCDRDNALRDSNPPNRTAGEALDDKTLTANVKAALDADAIKYPDVKVSSYKGVVQLSGFADTRDQKSHAGDVAEKVVGVHKVENNITIKEAKKP